MPESGPLGSERGAAGNGRPYRERGMDDPEYERCHRREGVQLYYERGSQERIQ